MSDCDFCLAAAHQLEVGLQLIGSGDGGETYLLNITVKTRFMCQVEHLYTHCLKRFRCRDLLVSPVLYRIIKFLIFRSFFGKHDF